MLEPNASWTFSAFVGYGLCLCLKSHFLSGLTISWITARFCLGFSGNGNLELENRNWKLLFERGCGCARIQIFLLVSSRFWDTQHVTSRLLVLKGGAVSHISSFTSRRRRQPGFEPVFEVWWQRAVFPRSFHICRKCDISFSVISCCSSGFIHVFPLPISGFKEATSGLEVV